MAERGMRRSAAYGALAGLVVLAGAFQTACHRRGDGPDNGVEAPVVGYRTPAILATAGQPFTSVAPDATAYVHFNGVGTILTTGFSFAVHPDLPGGLALDRTTGVIAGTPAATSALAAYTITATNAGGTGSCMVSLGVQAAPPNTLSVSYDGQPNAAAGVVGALLTLNPPTVQGDTATGFGVGPVLPAGLALNRATGLVSGRPTEALAGQAYTLTATTPSGCVNTTFTLRVAAVAGAGPAGLAYDPAQLAGTAGSPFSGPVPTLTAGSDVVYTVSPALPAGLAMDPLTGQIAGTPAGTSPQADYTVTASNSVGIAQATVQVTVN